MITTSRHDEEPAGRGEAGEDGDQHSALAGQVDMHPFNHRYHHSPSLALSLSNPLFPLRQPLWFSGGDLKTTAHQLSVSGQ